MSMGGKSTQKSTQENLPPSWAAPNFRKAAQDALALYNSGQGNEVYQGPRVADLSGQTNNAISGLSGAASNYTNNSYINNALNRQNSSSTNLQNIASSDFIGNNQEFKNSLQNTLNNVADTINSQFSGAGRYGSGANTGVLANKLGQVASSALADQYNKDVANNLSANAQIDQANNNQAAAANNYYNGESNAFINDLKGGNVLDENAQNKLNAAMQKFMEERSLPHDRLLQLLRESQLAAGNYGTQSQETTSKTGGNFLQSLAGIFGDALSLGKSL